MREIDLHSIQILEFPKIKGLIAGLTLSPYGRIMVENLRPRHDREEIERRLRQSFQMREVIRFEEALPLIRVNDIGGPVNQSTVIGMHLEPKILLEIKLFLDTVVDLDKYGKEEGRRDKFPDLVEIMQRLRPKREICRAIEKAIGPNGDVLDSASGALTRLRRDLQETDNRVRQHLSKILAARHKHAGWQDDVITIRDGRYVIPVVASDFRADRGIVHDKSHSGATLFVEPESAIPINNKLRQLQQDEKVEVDRILKELTAQVGAAASDILADMSTYGLLDMVHACASFALRIGAESPQISSPGELELYNARHPLLLQGMTPDKVVPIDVRLDRDTQGILITGPNTGGKTVAVKTIGLLTLMAMTGLEIPADGKSRVGLYGNVYADIGDEQSLELSLSTFSSHIRNIIAALREADNNTLVLFDEIGAGTDPKEGAALAEVIILTLLDRGCNLVATTHYSQLKTLPLEHPGLINASLEFDKENLQPTFRLKMGVPGSSYAIDIARRLGLPDDMADRAAGLLGSEEKSLDALIEKLDGDLDSVRRERQNLDDRLSRAGELEEFYRRRIAQIEQKEDELIKKRLEELDAMLTDSRNEINCLVRELRESQADSKKIKEGHRIINQRLETTAAMKKSRSRQKAVDGRVLKPGERVWIEKFQAEGEVVEMIGDKKVKVAIGNAFMTVDTIDVARKGDSPPAEKPKPKTINRIEASATENGFRPEIMLRGLTVEEAVEKMDKFIDDAILAGAPQVYIVHGKGTGTLRRRLAAYLKAHRAVDSIRIGDWNEGGHGVTIARLKT